MPQPSDTRDRGLCLHLVTLSCKDAAHAQQCIQALTEYGRPDALAFNCESYEFGLQSGSDDTLFLIERWKNWEDLDRTIAEKVVPNLPMYNRFLKAPFDPARDTVRITLKTSYSEQ